jgi:hypothetical protein
MTEIGAYSVEKVAVGWVGLGRLARCRSPARSWFGEVDALRLDRRRSAERGIVDAPRDIR